MMTSRCLLTRDVLCDLDRSWCEVGKVTKKRNDLLSSASGRCALRRWTGSDGDSGIKNICTCKKVLVIAIQGNFVITS